MNILARLRYFFKFNILFRPYWRYLGPHSQWRLDRARRKRFLAFCKERGIPLKRSIVR